MRAESKPLPVLLKAECEVHGVETFLRLEQGCLWACAGAIRAKLEGGEPKPCSSAVLDEHFTPDGFDVTVLHFTVWARVDGHEQWERWAKAWDEYLELMLRCMDAGRLLAEGVTNARST